MRGGKRHARVGHRRRSEANPLAVWIDVVANVNVRAVRQGDHVGARRKRLGRSRDLGIVREFLVESRSDLQGLGEAARIDELVDGRERDDAIARLPPAIPLDAADQ